MTQQPECKQQPGEFQLVIDRNRCEGKADCERVCPVAVFKVDTLPKDQRSGLSFKGKLTHTQLADLDVLDGRVVLTGLESYVVHSSSGAL